MKKIKSLSAVVICLCLIAGVFAGCSKISLEGQWKTSYDLSEELNKYCDMTSDPDYGEFYDVFNEQLTVDVIYTFDSDNRYTVTVDEDKLKSDLDSFTDKFINYLIEGMYKYGESEGIDRSEFDELYKEANGVSMFDDARSDSDADLAELYNEIIDIYTENETKNTVVEKDRFYVTDADGNKTKYETFTLEGDVLTISGAYDMNDNPIGDERYPLVLTKIA